MQSESISAILPTDGDWLDTLPYSTIIYPDRFRDRIKYFFWRLYTPLHPAVRDAALAVKILRHTGRQPFLLGTIAPHLNVQEFVAHLVSKGYGNHFVAWKDDREVVGLRCLESFARQYHIRVFEDGEVRAHYEYTPECYPMLHFFSLHQEERREEFLHILGNTIVPHTQTTA